MNELSKLITEHASDYPVAAREYKPEFYGYAELAEGYVIIRKHDDWILFADSNPVETLEGAVAAWEHELLLRGIGDDLVGCDGS